MPTNGIYVRSIDFPVEWSPGAPMPWLVQFQSRAALVCNAQLEAGQAAAVGILWTGVVLAHLTPPNDEIIDEHPLWDHGLSEVLWAGVVENSDIVAQARRYRWRRQTADLIHYLLVFKEVLLECVATSFETKLYPTLDQGRAEALRFVDPR